MKTYSISIPTVSHIDIRTAPGTILYYLLPYIIPWKLIGCTIDQLFDSTGVMDDIVYREIYRSDSVQFLLTS